MTDTATAPSVETAKTQTLPAVPKAPLRSGGAVMAFIPNDLDQIWRMAKMAVMGGMAPKSLVEGKDPDEATSACAIAIMAGAELGLTPLMSLRSYAVVNGRPSLWGDGIKAVVRKSGICAYIKTGYDDKGGWCEAKRTDTGEIKRVDFTYVQAKAAGLLDKKGPWSQGFKDMMAERRATFRCLNDLFADVLGGIASGEEAIEDGPMLDVSPQRSGPPSPPSPPAEDETSTEVAKDVVDHTPADDVNDEHDEIITKPLDIDAYLARVDEEMTPYEDEATFLAEWTNMGVETALFGDEAALDRAETLRRKHLDRVTGQGDMLGGAT